MEVTRRDQATFRELLARLKQRGCNLLVVGETDATTRRTASRQLFGDPDARRERLLVTTGEAETDEWLPAPGQVFEADVDTRGSSGTSAGAMTVQTSVRGQLADADDAPGRNRLGVTSLAPIIESENGEAVVDALKEAIREIHGMGHYHLSAPMDADLTQQIADDFDAVVELRSTPDGPQQRWHIHEGNVSTPWIPISE